MCATCKGSWWVAGQCTLILPCRVPHHTTVYRLVPYPSSSFAVDFHCGRLLVPVTVAVRPELLGSRIAHLA